MKKALIIVLFVFLLVGGGGLAAGYFFLYRPAKAYIVSFTQLQEIPKLEAQVRNKAAFTAPSDDQLTQERVDRFVRTQQVLREQLGMRVEELNKKYKTLNAATDPERRPSVKEALTALKDLTTLVMEAKRLQVEALNQNNFSIAEYDWTRARIYEASGIPIDLTFQYAIREAAAGRTPRFETAANEDERQIPAVNRSLVAPHLDKLTEAAPLAFFGL